MNISMKKLWMSAAILVICGASVLTSCTNDDNPVVPANPVTDNVDDPQEEVTDQPANVRQ